MNGQQLAELEAEFARETALPPAQWDHARVGELSEAICRIRGLGGDLEQKQDACLHAMRLQTANRKRQIGRRCAIFASAAALLLVTAGLMRSRPKERPNLASEVVSIDIDDPLGMRAACEKAGIRVKMPAYLPQPCTLHETDTQQSDRFTRLRFALQCGDAQLTICFTQYADPQAAPDTESPIGLLPSQTIASLTMTDTIIGGTAVRITAVDGNGSFFYAQWRKDGTDCQVVGEGLPYDEGFRIVESMLTY